MSMPRSRSVRTTSLRDPDTRFTDSEKIEGAGSWEALEWTKIDVTVANLLFPLLFSR